MPRLLRWWTLVAVAVGALSLAGTALAGTGWTVASTPSTSPGHVWAMGFGSNNRPLILSHS
jgi:hypothetical protein